MYEAEGTGEHQSCSLWCDHFDFVKKIMMTLAGVLLAYLIFYVGTLIHNSMRAYEFIGQADRMERTITVSGYGKVTGSNDIAMTTIGYSFVDKDVKKAQTETTKVMNQVMGDLKKMNIADQDLQSDFSIYPEYNYSPDKGQELKGYRVTQNVTIKIRDLSKITDVLGLAGKYGANQVNGLSFTIDDKEALKTQAREKALADAKLKAIRLGASLGVRVVSVVSYNEYESGGSPMLLKANYMSSDAGSVPAPESIAAGSNDVIMNVNVVYEIMP